MGQLHVRLWRVLPAQVRARARCLPAPPPNLPSPPTLSTQSLVRAECGVRDACTPSGSTSTTRAQSTSRWWTAPARPRATKRAPGQVSDAASFRWCGAAPTPSVARARPRGLTQLGVHGASRGPEGVPGAHGPRGGLGRRRWRGGWRRGRAGHGYGAGAVPKGRDSLRAGAGGRRRRHSWCAVELTAQPRRMATGGTAGHPSPAVQ